MNEVVVAERKPLAEILEMIRHYQKVLVVGCGGCMTVGLSGGAREVSLLAQEMILARQAQGVVLSVSESTVGRQCEDEFLEKLAEDNEEVEAILSLGCGVGVQAIAGKYPKLPVLPGLNTRFIGQPAGEGVWRESCRACGECILDKTAGICPVTLCPKGILNGPCGGSKNGYCEIGEETPCIWEKIYQRMANTGHLSELELIFPAQDWSKAQGPGTVARRKRRFEQGK